MIWCRAHPTEVSRGISNLVRNRTCVGNVRWIAAIFCGIVCHSGGEGSNWRRRNSHIFQLGAHNGWLSYAYLPHRVSGLQITIRYRLCPEMWPYDCFDTLGVDRIYSPIVAFVGEIDWRAPFKKRRSNKFQKKSSGRIRIYHQGRWSDAIRGFNPTLMY